MATHFGAESLATQEDTLFMPARSSVFSNGWFFFFLKTSAAVSSDGVCLPFRDPIGAFACSNRQVGHALPPTSPPQSFLRCVPDRSGIG